MSISKAEKNLPKKFRNEVIRLIHSNNRLAHRKNGKPAARLCALDTTKDREGVILLAFASLWEMGYKLTKPTNLAEKHINALAECWKDEGLADRTKYKRMSILRVFCKWIGKPGLVKNTIHYYGPELIRNVCATKNLTWEAHGIDVDGAIQKATALDERFGLMLSLQRYFGLRIKESIHLAPHRAMPPGSIYLMVSDGTKGGRPRFVPIETERQRQIMEWAKRITTPSPKSTLRWPRLTWTQSERKFNALMDRLGYTKKGSGVTAHGLRHAYAQDSYHGLTGLPTPIEGGALGRIDRETHREANEEVSRRLGHNRADVTGFYYGSYGHKLRESVTDRMLRRAEAIELPEKKPPRTRKPKPTTKGE